MIKHDEIKTLLEKPLCMMTGAEYVALHAYARTITTEGPEVSQAIRVKGVNAVADFCDCSPSQISKLLREGVLDSAIISRIGKSIVFNAETARRCASEYQEQQRALRREQKNR